MRVVLLAAASSIHTVRWANGLNAAGYDVSVISQHPVSDTFESGVQVHLLPFRGMAGYFTMVPAVRRLLRQIQPDLVNAHYASGYGTTARLANFHPLVLSVWGSDVYDFPFRSWLHKRLVKANLRAADLVVSTSVSMAKQIQSLAPEMGEIPVTPFGVELQPYESVAPRVTDDHSEIVVGTVKGMKHCYGIDLLIKAFAILVQRREQGGVPRSGAMRLRLVGGGEETARLRDLANGLGIGHMVEFVGQVPHEHVPRELEKLDIYVALSRRESFGVAILEAGAAGKPVVVSDVGGLPEVVNNGETGLVVPGENPDAAADAMERLVMDKDMRERMGVAARMHVREHYSWDASVQTMQSVYRQALENFRGR
ncbi:glycosyltransferase [Marinobacter sp. M1N3S26]|uniref:glycosyltransferase n=1 Tax=Marinobacter sp. M1N3S26 TaxID=3382299 RepID=UPI00387B8935